MFLPTYVKTQRIMYNQLIIASNLLCSTNVEKKHCRYLGYGLGFLCMGIIKGIYEIWAYVLLPNDPC